MSWCQSSRRARRMLGTRSTRASADGTGWTSRVGTDRDRTRAPFGARAARGAYTGRDLDRSAHGRHDDPADPPVTPRASARYGVRFASRAARIVSSVMRDLMSLSERPDIISLAGGFPNTEAFEREIFDEVMEVVARDHLASSLQYGPTEGMG